MANLYTAVNVKQFSEVLKTKNFCLTELEGNTQGLIFTEDKTYWINELQNQKDLENISDYKYSMLIEFVVDYKLINSLISDTKTGRLSQKLVDYYDALNKPRMIKMLEDNDTNVLCILDTYECEETTDGLSQKWLLKVESEESEIWQSFLNGVHRLSAIGGIPGAAEAANELLT